MSLPRWLVPVRAELDRVAAPSRWFFRDDDAGWADRELAALLAVFRGTGVTVDLAVIPAELTPARTDRLARWSDVGAVSVLQHGWAHANHQPTGRRSEFGSARTAGQMLDDLVTGRDVLRAALGERSAQVFVPPWNRCSPLAATLLPGLGFRVLSRDDSAGAAGVPGLHDVPVTVDWARHWREGGPEQLGRALAAGAADRAGSGAPVGVMLHHAVTDAPQRRALGRLLDLLARHRAVALSSLAATAGRPAATLTRPQPPLAATAAGTPERTSS